MLRSSIEKVTRQPETYRIVVAREMTIESMPPIEQTTYKKDDGRSVVTSFRGEERTRQLRSPS